MQLVLQSPKRALNKSYLKEKIARREIETLKLSLSVLKSKINEDESEEHLKNLIKEFLDDTWYHNDYELNTKDRKDLVIHLGKTAKYEVGVLLEVKRPSNKTEMLGLGKVNVKALHELVLYYLRERLDHNNSKLKHLVVTNIFEWYIIDELWFERNIFRSVRIKKEYTEWKASGKDTRFFYDSIVKPFLDTIDEDLPVTYLNLKEFLDKIDGKRSSDDSWLIPLYKVLSPAHLLKLPFANDSNTLNKKFYIELLYILGLEEKSKRIQLKASDNGASLIGNTIESLKSDGVISRIQNLSSFGISREEQYFNVGLELCITWINRILFLKLLEAQLVKYHNGDVRYKFLNTNTISHFGELNKLFFEVLAVRRSERKEHLQEKYQRVPYLNSSLFEPTPLEKQAFSIKGLDSELSLELYKSSVLYNRRDGVIESSLPILQYLFQFLDAYDFTSEGSGEIQEDDRNLISASVLGLIFEKINGYKEGSIYTPGFITMYMCRETIRKAIIKKINKSFNVECRTFHDLRNFISSHYRAEDILAFNSSINQLKVCDPAVGSGHFLVSALNEIIAAKAELGLLADGNGVRETSYDVRVENDELIITYNENTEIFEYRFINQIVPKNIQRLQKIIFHEKEIIIENCLYGVDINSNSVKICRLRLWIELLKHAYYTEESLFTELETLPNIDINIKQGNSLISRYAIDTNLKPVLRDKNISVQEYKEAVQLYKTAPGKDERGRLETLIEDIKKNIKMHIGRYNRAQLDLYRLQTEWNLKYNSKTLFEQNLTKSQKADKKALEDRIARQALKISDVKENKIYQNAFEWRFEFPEVLNDDGDFVGFDVIIGNPPYIFGGNEGITAQEKKFYSQTYESGKGKINLFTLFIERSFSLMVSEGDFSFIIPNTFLRVTSYHDARKLLIENQTLNVIKDVGDTVFEDAITTAIILIAEKVKPLDDNVIAVMQEEKLGKLRQSDLRKSNYVIALNNDDVVVSIISRFTENVIQLGEICEELIFGVVITKNKEEVVGSIQHPGWKPFLEGRDIGPYFIRPIHSYLNYEPKLLHRARSKEIFEVPEKILLQRITGGSQPLKAAYDNHQYYNKESINNVILKDGAGFECKYILALLNSKLINWYYTIQFTNKSRLTVNLSKEYLSQIPIARASHTQQKAFVLLVDYVLEILTLKKQIDEFVSNEHIVSEILEVLDVMVYELYFREEFIEQQLSVVEHVLDVFRPLNRHSPEGAIGSIRELYQNLRRKDNLIRMTIRLVDTRLTSLLSPIKIA